MVLIPTAVRVDVSTFNTSTVIIRGEPIRAVRREFLVDFGIQLCQEEFKYAELARAFEEIERMGFNSVWLYDHFYPMIDPTNLSVLECFTALSALAPQTKNIRIGALVACNSFRSPSLLAKIGASLDVISSGRLEFGIGAGWYKNEYEAYGFPFPDALVRLEQLREAVQVIKKLWTEPRASFEGKYYALRDAISEPKPIQTPHPPIWIGGSGEKVTLRIVAEFGDYCNLMGSPREFRRKLHTLEKHCSRVRRSFDHIRKSWHGFLVLVDDRSLTRTTVQAIKSKIPIERTREMKFDDFVQRNIVGDKQECMEKIDELVDAGATYIIPHLFDSASLRLTRAFSREIMPAFK